MYDQQAWLAGQTRKIEKVFRETVESKPDVLGGAPVFGNGLTVTHLLAELADGCNVDQIAQHYREDPGQLRRFLQALSVYLHNKDSFLGKITR